MTHIDKLIRIDDLIDIQIWIERDETVTVTAIFRDRSETRIALEIPEAIFNEIKATHALFDKNRGREIAVTKRTGAA